MNVNIKEVDTKFDMSICKVNKEVVGTVIEDYLTTVNRSINDMDTLEFKIPKSILHQYTFKNIINPIYYEIKEERLILLNDKEYFVIKEKNKEVNSISFKAYSLEYRLSKIDINLEDVGICLNIEDKENNIINLNSYMYNETGWHFGVIDDTVRYFKDKSDKNIDKMRWIQSTSKRWYDFLINDVSTMFGCIVVFDTFNKLVNLYDINTEGEEVQVYLSYDNYIKELNNNDTSNEIVTRLYLTGNEEMDIIGATVTGYPYIENYSYYIDNEEMSKELIVALNKYHRIVEIRDVEWHELINVKNTKQKLLDNKEIELLTIYSEIKGYNGQIDAYESIIQTEKDPIIVSNTEKNKAISISELTKRNDRRVILEQENKVLYNEIKALKDSINNLNILCKRETATDENGHLIFNVKLLDELKEYVSCDTYNNDSFLDVNDLIKAGIRELNLKCKPTSSYKLDIVNFTKRIISDPFRKQLNIKLSLGNIIALENNDKEILQYLVGFTLNRKESNQLELDISDRKVRNDNTRTIGDYLTDAKRSMNDINRKQYLLNKAKYKKLNS